ncbi:MAG: polyprenyl synthetase family protein, partial [Candidatus Saccharimonadales bacterium]
VAYQLHDDYLGIWGDVAGQGKSNLDDVRDGKRTAYVGHVLTHGDEAARSRLLQILGNPDADETDLSEVRAIFEQTGASTAVLAAEQAANAEAQQALRAPTFHDRKFSSVLGELIHYATTRKS